jgi:hypothetical protein
MMGPPFGADISTHGMTLPLGSDQRRVVMRPPTLPRWLDMRFEEPKAYTRQRDAKRQQQFATLGKARVWRCRRGQLGGRCDVY